MTAALCAAALPACALEHVTLRTGFAYDCTRMEPLNDGHVRLYMGQDAANYVVLAADLIERVETLPDPPPAIAASAAPVVSVDVPTLLSSAGAKHNIDVDLLASVVKAESGGHERAVSRTGAQGLMQLMPGTAKQMGVSDAFKPDQNINGGTAYLDALLTRYHDNLPLALAAYNAGPGAVDRYHGVPPFRETRAYVVRVIREFKRRKDAKLSTVASR